MAAPARSESRESEEITLITNVGQSSRERARAYFVDGAKAASRGAWREAIDLYLEAYVEHPHPSILHNIGYCYHQSGDIYHALMYSARALYETPPEGVTRLTEVNKQAVTAQLLSLRSSLGEVVFAEGALPKHVGVNVDGMPVVRVPLGGGVWGLVPGRRGDQRQLTWNDTDVLLLTGGTHQIELYHESLRGTSVAEVTPGKRTLLTVQLWPIVQRDEADRRLGAVAKEQSRRSPPKGTLALAGAPVSAPRVEHPEGPSAEASRWRDRAYVSWAVSGAAFGFAAFAWSRASSLNDKLEVTCDGQACPPSRESDVTRYDQSVFASYLGLGVGVLAAATGGVFWVIGDSKDMALSFGSAQVSLRGRF